MSDAALNACHAATERVLHPLVRILLRNGISYGQFADWAKRVFVDVAEQDFALNGRKQTQSRVSVLTGLSRKEVARIRRLPDADDTELHQRYHRAARVIAGWRRDSQFHDRSGRPAALPFEADGGPSFSGLVRGYSGDMPARAVLDELLRVGAVRRSDAGAIELLAPAFVPRTQEADQLHILGLHGGDLLSTIDHNLAAEGGDPRYERAVAYDNLPREALPELRRICAEHAQTLLEKIDEWLARHDRDASPATHGEGRMRAGLGVYYFESEHHEE